MYYLRYYEMTEIKIGCGGPPILYITESHSGWNLGPGFLNQVNRYYGYRMWR